MKKPNDVEIDVMKLIDENPEFLDYIKNVMFLTLTLQKGAASSLFDFYVMWQNGVDAKTVAGIVHMNQKFKRDGWSE